MLYDARYNTVVTQSLFWVASFLWSHFTITYDRFVKTNVSLIIVMWQANHLVALMPDAPVVFERDISGKT